MIPLPVIMGKVLAESCPERFFTIEDPAIETVLFKRPDRRISLASQFQRAWNNEQAKAEPSSNTWDGDFNG
jgi:hypothetical protein